MDELTPEARELVEQTRRARTPDDHDKARVRAALAASLGAAGAASAAGAKAASAAMAGGSVAATSGATGVWTKVVVSVLLAASVGGGYLAVRHATQAPARNGAVTEQPAGESPALAPMDRPDAEVAPTPNLVEAPQPPPPKTEAEPAPAPPSEVARKPARRVRRRAPSASHSFSTDVQLLRNAQAAHRAGHLARALRLARTHARRYPKSPLAPERDTILVLTLCELGKTSQAKAHARRVLKRAPKSPVRAAIEESCAAP